MENASKALLFAAGILIAIILISVAVYIVSMSNNATTGVANQMTEMELKAFNQKFTTYDGLRTGSQLKTLVEVVNTSNASEDLKVTIEDKTTKNKITLGGDENKGYTVLAGSAMKYRIAVLKEGGSAVTKIQVWDQDATVTSN